jgi:hypothetical protein
MFSSCRACYILLLNYKYHSVDTAIGNNLYFLLYHIKPIYKVSAHNSDHLNVIYMVTIVLHRVKAKSIAIPVTGTASVV